MSVVKYFIKELECDPNVRGQYYRTPLHFASKKGNINIIKFLLDYPSTHSMAADEDNNTPLHYAALNIQLQAFHFFINHVGCDPSIKGQLGWRPLHMASASGNLELIRYLVEDLNCSPSIDEKSPLVIAKRNGNDEVVTYFLEIFPWILNLNQFGEISSSMQELSIKSSISSERCKCVNAAQNCTAPCHCGGEC